MATTTDAPCTVALNSDSSLTIAQPAPQSLPFSPTQSLTIASQIAGKYDFLWSVSLPISQTFFYNNSSGVANNLAGYGAAFLITPLGSAAVILQASTRLGSIVITGSLGKLVMSFTQPQIATLDGTYKYTFVLMSTLNTRILNGLIITEP